MPKVTMIPATINPLTHLPSVAARKRRVAGYARVSTDSDEQFTSYEAQIDYYTKFIQQHEDWTYVSMYTDEGITGTNTKKREGFNQMVYDALAGNIDLSLSRSAVSPATPWTVWSRYASSRNAAWRFSLKRRTSGRWIPKASC